MAEVEYSTPQPRPKPKASTSAATTDLPIVRYSSKIYHQELSKVLVSEYVQYAFTLPDCSGSIWTLLQSDMESLAWGNEAFTQDQINLLTFLARFFSPPVIQAVEDNLLALADSHHGLNYTLRRSKAAIGKSIVDGIREEAAEHNTPLAAFLGQVSLLGTDEEREKSESKDEGWQIVTRRRAKGKNPGLPSQGSQGASTTTGSGDGRSMTGGGDGGGNFAAGGGGDSSSGARQDLGSGGADGSGDDRHEGGHFSSMRENTIEVHLPYFVTPPRGDPDRKLKVRDRSLLFKEKVQRWCGRLYDPQYQQAPGFVSIFHGTRTSSLESFQCDGISPDFEGSEFSRRPAFYVSNSVLHAFERPLHYKLGRCVGDFISVLEFRVDLAVLHGEKAPPGESKPFDVRWFPRPCEEWKRFCIGNMAVDPKLKALAPLHAHDIVIGPVCKPLEGGTDMGIVSDRLERETYVCQVAFCTQRSWSFLEHCFRKVYQESRDADAASVCLQT